jgi:urease accessory protein
MIVRHIVGNIFNTSSEQDLRKSDPALLENEDIEWIELEWEELNKRILRKMTDRGREIGISLQNGERLSVGDIVYADEQVRIAVRTQLEQVYVIRPQSMQQMGKAAFELGNRHTPSLIQEDEIIVREDETLPKLLDEVGVEYERTKRRFTQPFKYRGHSH